jgi:molybdopterin biosynthesis enzyme
MPTIAVLSTGDELVEPTTGVLNRGQVLYFSGNFNSVVEAKRSNA